MRTFQTPVSIKKRGGKQLEIGWDDGHVSLYSFRYLRQRCSCAACVEEWSGKAILQAESVALDLEGLKVSPVGNYALVFSFSDHHDTGIYNFEHLRAICPCETCRPKEGGN
jgi:DUF971 family protein